MLKSEFDPKTANWFEDKRVWIDLGYLGFDKDYPAGEVQIPIKKPRRKKKTDPRIELTEAQKKHNKQISSRRIYVEHAIGGLKRYRFLSDRLRCRNARFYSTVLGVCAGLWNFQLTCS
ncbi:hypothetical protein CEQ90_18305 [Lewinellaceae bacterium SD302]|nr:hypothetical protein CEQ90_18305 [Lewinellaceae bacterium SD302]